MTIFDFKDYRDFLKSWMIAQPRRGRGLQLKMAEAAQVQATFMSQVLSKKMHLSTEQIYSLTKFMDLAENETEFLQLQVQHEKAGKKEFKDFLQNKIDKMRNEAKQISSHLRAERAPSTLDTQKYFSSWVYPAVHLLCLIPGFTSPAPIAERLNMEEARIEDIIRFLLHAGLIEFRDGVYQSSSLRLHAEKGSPNLMGYQLTTRSRAQQKISEGSEELHFTSIHSANAEDHEKIKKEILALIRKSDRVIAAADAKDVYALTIDFFKL